MSNLIKVNKIFANLPKIKKKRNRLGMPIYCELHYLQLTKFYNWT